MPPLEPSLELPSPTPNQTSRLQARPANLEDCMRLLENRQNLVSIALLALLITLVAPGTAFAKRDDQGRRRDRDDEKHDRKCEKFVNCHDARDGRRDGRGPQRDWDDRTSRRRHRGDRRWDRRDHRSDRGDRRWDRRDRRFDDRVGDRRDWRDARFQRRHRRHDDVRNRTDRRFDVREVNQLNTARFRRNRS